jgi:small subunit ribosomal protein S3
MGNKINPVGFRVGISRDWSSRWLLSKKETPKALLEDLRIRDFIKQKFDTAGLKSVDIERSPNELHIFAKVSKPGVVIGKGGAGVESIIEALRKTTKSKVSLTVEEVKVPEIEAQLVGDYISRQLKRRMPYRRVMLSAVNSAMDRGAKGIKIKLSGLLGGGNTISRTETLVLGSVPSQTLRADIDYAQIHCQRIFGVIGIKVWIYKGEKEI